MGKYQVGKIFLPAIYPNIHNYLQLKLMRIILCHLEFGRCRVICIDLLPARFPPFLPGMPYMVCANASVSIEKS
jgi:hypothetical protein